MANFKDDAEASTIKHKVKVPGIDVSQVSTLDIKREEDIYGHSCATYPISIKPTTQGRIKRNFCKVFQKADALDFNRVNDTFILINVSSSVDVKAGNVTYAFYTYLDTVYIVVGYVVGISRLLTLRRMV